MAQNDGNLAGAGLVAEMLDWGLARKTSVSSGTAGAAFGPRLLSASTEAASSSTGMGQSHNLTGLSRDPDGEKASPSLPAGSILPSGAKARQEMCRRFALSVIG